jgi:hypothetical protein
MHAPHTRRLILLLAALTALMLAGGSSSLAAGGAQTNVRAFDETAPSLIRLQTAESSCTRPGSISSTARTAAGFLVATEEGFAPIAGGSEITAGDLTGDAAANYGRFLKSLPASAEEPTITGLPGGGFKFEADVPGIEHPGLVCDLRKGDRRERRHDHVLQDDLRA